MNKKPTIDIEYRMETTSLYSDAKSAMYCSSREQCGDVLASHDPDMLDADPLDNGFNVSGLAKGNKCFLRMKENSSSDSVQYEFPSSEQKSDEEGQLLVHGPDEIWGHEGEELILGTVSAFHGSNSVEYKWLIDGVPICSANACTHVVT